MDSGVNESLKDVLDEFKKSDQFTVVKTASEATIVLTLVGRRVAGSSGSVGVPIGTTMMFLPIHRRAIDTILRVRDYEKAITSEDEKHDRWRAAAQQVVKDVTAWVNANREQLKED
jgi:hypothetical protein